MSLRQLTSDARRIVEQSTDRKKFKPPTIKELARRALVEGGDGYDGRRPSNIYRLAKLEHTAAVMARLSELRDDKGYCEYLTDMMTSFRQSRILIEKLAREVLRRPRKKKK